jgi:hypothetical protein
MATKKKSRFETLFPQFDETVKQLLKDVPDQLAGLENPTPPKGAERRERRSEDGLSRS